MSINLRPYTAPAPDTSTDMHMDQRGRPAYTTGLVERILADAHAHYEAQISAANADGPSTAQMEAGAQALRECGLNGSRESLMATADSVYRAMQEVRVAQPAGDAVMPVAAWVDPRTLDVIQKRGEEGSTDAIMKERCGRFTAPLVTQADAQAALAAKDERIAGLEAELVEAGLAREVDGFLTLTQAGASKLLAL
jgi:hypothetical protein